MKKLATTAILTIATALPASAGTLNLLTWEGYADPSFVEPFTAATGCEVKAQYVGSGDETATTILTGRGKDYDLIAVAAEIVPIFIDAGAVEPIDMSRIPNAEGFFPAFKQPDYAMRGDKQYALPYTYGIIRFIADMDKIDTLPDSLSALWDPAMKDQVTLWDDLEAIYMAGRYLGFDDVYNMTDDQLAQARDALIDMKTNVRRYWFSAGELTSLYQSHDVALSNTWETTILDMKNEGRNVQQWVPKEGRGGWIDSQMIIKGHADNECVYQWLDYTSSAEVQATSFGVTGFTYSNAGMYDLLDADGKAFFEFLGANKIDALEGVDWFQPVPNRGKYLEAWNQVKAASQLSPGPMANAIELQGIEIRYGDFTAVSDLDLEVPEGAFLSFLGASGCGKSSTLRLIAGLEEAAAGRILFRGQEITELPPALRDMRMMFLDYALFPNMTVEENIAFPLTLRRAKGRFPDPAKRARDYLALVHMETYAKRRPYELSGGQRQRIALARALVSDPAVVLFDEPLGALDASLRHAMQFELKRIHADQGKTFISVTHDQEEAMAMSDLIALMKDGKLMQIGSPEEIYSNPRSRYVAEFMGSGSSVIDVTVARRAGDGVALALPDGVELVSTRAPSGLQPGDAVGLHLRPELIGLSITRPEAALNVLPCVIEEFIFLGGRTEYQVRLDDAPDVALTVTRSGPPRGGEVHGAPAFLHFDPASIGVLTE